jgi:hypothetical protein
MKTLHILLIILLLIVITAASMMSYKIETFSNTFLQTPNNETCYNYIKNVKKWNVDELTKEQKKVLFTMRAAQGAQYSDNSKVFPFKDACVIPYNHLPIFNTSENATSLTVYPKNKPSIKINNTDQTMSPQGVYVDFADPEMTFDKFKDLLAGGYLLYDSDFIIESQKLNDEIKKLTNTRDYWKNLFNRLFQQTKHYNINLIYSLSNPNSECQEIKKYNNSIIIPQWDKYLAENNIIINNINQLWSKITNAWNKIRELQKC